MKRESIFFTAIIFATAFGTLAQDTADANSGMISEIFHGACSKYSCKDTWYYKGQSFSHHCSVASGSVPSLFTSLTSVPLPMIYEGNYDLCQTFEDAHFCRVEIPSIFTLPDFQNFIKLNGLPQLLPLGPLSYDICVSKLCSEEELTSSLFFGTGIVNKLASLVLNEVREDLPKEQSENLRQFFANSLKKVLDVKCYDKNKSDFQWDQTGLIVGILLSFWILAVITSTITSWILRLNGTKDVFLLQKLSIFDISGNLKRLTATPRESHFKPLDGLRAVSMFWIIGCHNTMRFFLKTRNPTKLGELTHGLGFTFIRGGFFAVDTFFFLGGFLSANLLVKELLVDSLIGSESDDIRERLLVSNLSVNKTSRLSIGLYMKLIFLRYLRITPIFLTITLIFWKIIPGFENLFLEKTDLVNEVSCTESFFPFNVLYLNVFFTGKNCAPWSWYLANDFYFNVIGPLLIHAYFKLKKKAQNVRFILFAIVFILQIILTAKFEYETFHGKVSAFSIQVNEHYYKQPLFRITPYISGIVLFLILKEMVETPCNPSKLPNFQSIRISYAQTVFNTLLSIIGFISLVLIYSYSFSCSESEHDCKIYNSQLLYGYFVDNKFSRLQTTFIYSCCFLIWSGCLALLLFTVLTHERNDILGIRKFLNFPIFNLVSRL
eukprot:snap_masked-scaffold_34-processed-gene-1.55-mRNA-1 protein AED:1.00 eAED:1.00 QI:0/0/0/0/1/1/2/0/661